MVKKWTPGNQNTYSNPQNLRAQSYKADKAFVDLRERERERVCVTECDPLLCVGVWGACEREGKGSKGIFGNIKSGGAENATWTECLFYY